jgi:thiol-disulfide isomerase/thioredoxin
VPILVGFLVLIVACVPATAGELADDFQDFDLISYQGNDIFGGDVIAFSRVFERDKPVVLNFWAGQCPPCRAEMPDFQKIADEYDDQVIVVGLDIGVFTGLGSHDDARDLLRDLAIQYPTGYAVDSAPMRQYGVRGMPTTVFLTPDGQVADQVTGLLPKRQLRERVENLIAASR